MKRFIPLIIATALTLSTLTACGGSANNTSSAGEASAPKVENTEPATEESSPEPATEEGTGQADSGSDIATGLGVVTSIGKSASASADKDGVAQVDSTIAVVTLDGDGKITKLRFDSAQTVVGFNAQGAITADLTADIKTKIEKGADYGMIRGSQIGKEWFEQADAFSEWAIGKTLAELEGIQTKKVDDAHLAVPDVPELTSSVTIDVGDFIEATKKAAKSAVAANAGSSYKTGLGVISGIDSSKDATAEAAGVGQVDSTLAAVTVDENGIIIACVLDNAQTKVNFDAQGAVTSDLAADIKTKVEIGEGYGMKKNSSIDKEWDEQAAAFAEWTVGKTVAEVTGLTTKKVDDSHPEVADVPELTSSVTVDVGDFKRAIEKAVANSK